MPDGHLRLLHDAVRGVGAREVHAGVDLLHDGARVRELLRRLLHQETRLRVRLVREPAPHETEARRRQVAADGCKVVVSGNVGAVRVVRIMHGEHTQQQRDVLDAPHEHADVVERGCHRHDAEARDPSERGLEANDPVVRGGAQHGADGLGAERPRHHARGDRDAGAGAGAAGRVLDVPGVEAGRRVAVGELSGVQLAEQHCARVSHEGYGRGVGVGHALGPYLRAGRRADARCVEDVLRAVGDTRERASRAGGCGVGGAGGSERLLRQERRPSLQSRLQRLDAREQRLGQFDR